MAKQLILEDDLNKKVHKEAAANVKVKRKSGNPLKSTRIKRKRAGSVLAAGLI